MLTLCTELASMKPATPVTKQPHGRTAGGAGRIQLRAVTPSGPTSSLAQAEMASMNARSNAYRAVLQFHARSKSLFPPSRADRAGKGLVQHQRLQPRRSSQHE
jgi:hypothetical protein